MVRQLGLIAEVGAERIGEVSVPPGVVRKSALLKNRRLPVIHPQYGRQELPAHAVAQFLQTKYPDTVMNSVPVLPGPAPLTVRTVPGSAYKRTACMPT